MKRLLNKAIVLAMMAATWMGCSQDEVIVDCDVKINTAQESESGIPINLTLSIPDAVNVGSRTGITEVIQNITVLCFDQNHKLLSSIPVTRDNLTTTSDEAGSLSVVISNKTRVLHLIANQMIELENGAHESELENLESVSNKMIYWARMEVPVNTTSEMKEWAKNGTKHIRLLRNMAKVLVSCDTEEFVLLGYTVVNTSKEGYVAPYKAEDEVFPTDTIGDYTPAFTLEDWSKESYVHAKGTETVSSDWILNDSVYVYETLSDTKPCIIIKGRNAEDPEDVVKYWRVAFTEDGEKMLNIRRNHRYQVSIEGFLMYGDSDFNAALNSGTSANNVWLSIGDEVTAIKDNHFSLTLKHTNYVLFDGTTSHNFSFDIKQLGEETFDVNALKVEWKAGENDALDKSNGDGISYSVSNSGDIYTGNVCLSLAELGEVDRREGTVVITYGKKLQRKVKIYIINKQNFEEVGYQLQNPDDSYTEPIALLKFTIPNDYPGEYPFNVLISSADFNVSKVNDNGLLLVFPNDAVYGEDNGIGYKFLYQVTAPGEQTVGLVCSVIQNYGKVILESEYFEDEIIEKIPLNATNITPEQENYEFIVGCQESFDFNFNVEWIDESFNSNKISVEWLGEQNVSSLTDLVVNYVNTDLSTKKGKGTVSIPLLSTLPTDAKTAEGVLLVKYAGMPLLNVKVKLTSLPTINLTQSDYEYISGVVESDTLDFTVKLYGSVFSEDELSTELVWYNANNEVSDSSVLSKEFSKSTEKWTINFSIPTLNEGETGRLGALLFKYNGKLIQEVNIAVKPQEQSEEDKSEDDL